jgi:hypothetical protein
MVLLHSTRQQVANGYRVRETQLPSEMTSNFEAGFLEIVIFCFRCDGMGEIRSIVDTKFETLFCSPFFVDWTKLCHCMMPVGKPSWHTYNQPNCFPQARQRIFGSIL